MKNIGRTVGNSRQFVSSLARGFLLLDTICKSQSPLGLSQLAKQCQLSISTIQRLAYTLQDLGLISRDEKTKKFRVGPRTIALASTVTENFDLKKIAGPIMKALADETDEVIGLGVLSGDQIVLLEIVINTEKIIKINVNPGDTLPLNATASGKVILAFLHESQRRTLLKKVGLTSLTTKTITSIEDIEDQLQQVKQSGYATAVDEWGYGLSTIAAPIWNEKNEVIATLTIMVPTARMSRRNKILTYKDKVMQTASEISQAIGYKAG